MSNRTRFTRIRRAAVALSVVSAFAAVPAAAQAAPVDLATAGPFVALGGQSVTNAGGPSTLYGDLGVSPGTSLFGSPSIVHGATHNNDGVADQAQLDLTTAFDTAAGALPVTDLTGQDLGGQILPAGNYSFSSSAQLTGPLVLDAAGDTNAQFVIKVGTQLTTASASSVQLIRGASPCNVYWKVDTAVLGSTTAFQGNILALTSINLNDAASIKGRALARNGSVTLIHNVLDASMCGAGNATPPITGGTPSGGTTPATGAAPPTGTTHPFVRRPNRTTRGTAIVTGGPRSSCTAGFTAQVRGHLVKRVAFSLDGKHISSRTRSPFKVYVKAAPGMHKVRARVTFKDATRAKTMTLRYRACAAALLQPRRGPSRFTG
jgi:hypothetical protein